MSLAGLKKQFNKANQYVTEKIGGAEGTKLDDEYINIEQRVDAITKLLEELVTHTNEYLQPNPTYRARLATVNTFNKLQGKSKAAGFPHPETLLGDSMLKNSTAVGMDTCFGQCLSQSGDAFKALADAKYNMEDHVKDKFLNHITGLQQHEIKEISHHRKKLEGRRLDFDCKKRKQDRATLSSKLPEDELAVAEEKFQESKVLAEQAMNNFLNCEVEQIQALAEFVSAQVDYHRQATDIMEQLHKYLVDKKDESDAKPKSTHEPKRLSGLLQSGATAGYKSSTNNVANTPVNNGVSRTPNSSQSGNVPSCRAMYDFEAESPAELAFSEGNVIRLTKQVDEHWFEGEMNGKIGYFPITYVEVINPLP